MRILKFGGSSLSSPELINNVLEIIKSIRAQEQMAVVVSAFGGVTDKLIEIGTLATAGQNAYFDMLKQVEQKHINVVKSLIDMNRQTTVLTMLNKKYEELRSILQGVYLLKELSPRTLDLIMSYGERFSAFIITESLKGRGVDAEYLNASRLVKTDDNFGHASVKYQITARNIRDYFESRESLQVITGFIACTENNEITTLGRSGSDYTASLFGAALQAFEIEIWTDVDGVMTADPRMVPQAFSIESMTYEEAMEVSHFGAKVIHPQAMQPAMEQNIPIRIRNTFNPEFKGTLISEQSVTNTFLIKGISAITEIALLRVQGSGMLGVAGISARLFGTLAKAQINIILISQASSEHSICFAVEPNSALQAKKVIEKEFHLEILAHQIEEVSIEEKRAVIAVVGEKMCGTPGIAARIFNALGKEDINVVAIAQGSSELNISIVVNIHQQAAALKALHETFFVMDKKTLHLYLVGVGLVGGNLLKQIHKQKEFLDKEYSLDIKVHAIANSKKMVLNNNGIRLEKWREILEHSTERMKMDELILQMKNFSFRYSIFIDCTASESIADYYERILNLGSSIVTPNKKANSSSFEKYRNLKTLALKRGVKFLYETNVGASLPIIGTLKDLILSGDKILKIETIISGTISYVFNSFNGQKRFSEIVRDAQQKGYTEPDPRDDLNGLDVARKLLILAREVGLEWEAENISVENILPKSCQKADSVDEFFLELQKEDAYFEHMQNKAKKNSRVLRYIATLEDGKANVCLQAVNEQHPFYYLNGNENIIAITTERYKEKPIVIKGPGAGGDLTAAGIFADIIRVGNS